MSDSMSFVAATQAIEVSDTGGKFNGGYIKNFSIIKVGEALGHGVWVDEAFVEAVGDMLEAASEGVRSRYTHPEARETLSRGLGRVFLMSRGDGELRGELHFWPAARVTPHGDLASHIIQLAKDDPGALGSSISFKVDREAMRFSDINNPKGLPHVRIAALRFVDLVDSPATNPNGLFSEEIDSEQAELAYAFGFTDKKPETSVLGVEPDKLLDSVSFFLNSKGYEIVKLNLKTQEEQFDEQDTALATQEPATEPEQPQADQPVETVAEQVEEPAEPVAEQVEEPAEPAEPAEPQGHFQPERVEGTGPAGGHFSEADLEKYISNFGKEDGVDYFLGKIDFAEAQAQHIQKLSEKIRELENRLELSETTENTPFSAGNADDQKPRGKGFASRIKV